MSKKAETPVIPEDEKVKALIIYAGARLNMLGKLSYTYYTLNSLDDNYPEADCKGMERHTYDQKLFKNGGIGAIYEVSFTGSSILFNKDRHPLDIWKNERERIEWRAADVGAVSAKKIKEDTLDNPMIKSLQPIRNAYKQGNYEVRRAIMSEVMRIISQ